MFKRDKLHVAVDIVAIATEELARNRKEVVFYFLARILKNEERESRRKKVNDTNKIPGYQLALYLSGARWLLG